MIKKLTSTIILAGVLTVGTGVFAEEQLESPVMEEVVDQETVQEEVVVTGQEEENTEVISSEVENNEVITQDENQPETSDEIFIDEEKATTDVDASAETVVTPESNLYEAIRLIEEAIYDLTEDTTEKALLQDEYADNRLEEAEEMIETGNEEAAEELINDFETNVIEVETVLGETETAGEDLSEVNEVNEVIIENGAKRSQNLLALLEREDLPEQAKAGIRKALANQERAMQRAAKAIEKAEEEAVNAIEKAEVEAVNAIEKAEVEAVNEIEKAEEKEVEKESKKVKENAEKAKEKAEEKAEKAREKAEKAREKAEEKAKKANEKAEEKAEKARGKAEEKAGNASEHAEKARGKVE